MSFHRTSVEYDGWVLRRPHVFHYNAGDIVNCGSNGAFSDCVILGFTEDGKTAKLARPYVYASCTGTTGPTALTGVEIFECPVERLGTVHGRAYLT